jgi:DNA-binding MarR family transcriptional regulator
MADGALVAEHTGQMELRLGRANPALTAAQAACMRALRKGAASKSQIAIAASLTHYEARSALLTLAGLRLAERTSGNRWRPTRRGKACRFRTIPGSTRPGAGKLGRAAMRALRALDRPMTASELAGRLGVTRQRAHQLILDLHAGGRVRLGEGPRRIYMVARADDTTPLLAQEEQRVLSAIPERYATTAARIGQAGRTGRREAERVLGRLLALGLADGEDTAAGTRLYRLTKTGAGHPQYRATAGRASPPPLPVRSDRVCAVLAQLADRGQAQITAVRDALGIEQPSINALFQYLKRKALVRKTGEALRAPYVLTPRGHEVLAEMQRRRAG